MKFKVPGKTFQTHLQAVNKVMNSKNTITALDNFLLKIEGNTLWITGSDSENTMMTHLEIFEVEGEGEVAVPSKTIIDITKEIGNQPITFEMDDTNFHIEINYMNGHFEFMGENGNEYPKREEDNEEKRMMVVPAEVVAKGIEHTIFAVSSEIIRPMMTGIFWDIKENEIVFVSTDTHKLVRYINRQVAPGFEGGFILPSKPASIIRSVISKEDTEVKIALSSRGATFEVGDYSISCKFIKGTYPNYNRVIPKDSPYTLTINRETMLNALRRVALVASKSTSLVKLHVSPSALKLTTRDFDYAKQGEETVECTYDGEEMTIGFSTQYMIEILSSLDCEDIYIKLADPARPGLFQPLEQKPEEDIVILQMPIQVLE